MTDSVALDGVLPTDFTVLLTKTTPATIGTYTATNQFNYPFVVNRLQYSINPNSISDYFQLYLDPPGVTDGSLWYYQNIGAAFNGTIDMYAYIPSGQSLVFSFYNSENVIKTQSIILFCGRLEQTKTGLPEKYGIRVYERPVKKTIWEQMFGGNDNVFA